ncbi:hypothetical protein [Nocardiopsis sp. NRRL B-16309]|uniref:hypothetical protein n=1 Tax=Nocardiopsis sp. NRRL B-16309 TaxID=1519494 RepID=UPI0006AE460E|nr:hypothetical protein [Nocardiopsis sp. NRRL B-16309]KOX15199.1 hypothetical protein ADL05_16085 [Nocardiopsis sp. NRRL B-16309]
MRSLWNLISLPLFQRRDEPASSMTCRRCRNTDPAPGRVPAPAPAAPRSVREPFSAAEWDEVVRAAAIDKVEQVLADSYALLAEQTPLRPADSPDLAHVRRIRAVLTVLAEDLGPRGRAARPDQRDWIDSELLPAVLRAEAEIGSVVADSR